MKDAFVAALWQVAHDTYAALAADPSYAIALAQAALSLFQRLVEHIKN